MINHIEFVSYKNIVPFAPPYIFIHLEKMKGDERFY